jgi:uracil-DNA glycosylase
VSHDDPRAEAAGIAHGVRRYLERAAAAGTGDLLAREAVGRAAELEARLGESQEALPAAARRRANDPPAAAAARNPGAPPSHALAGVNPSAEPAAAPARFDSPEAARQAAGTLAFDLPSHHAPLNPAGFEARAALFEASLPILGAIAGQVNPCTKCGLSETRTKAVPGTGSARSGIVFVGEAPGAEEDRQGIPFVGRAGDLLTRIIQAMDDAKLIPGVKLDRETVYIANVLKCRPPENRNPLPHEIETCSPYLLHQLETLKPRIICCLGKFAAELLVGVKGTIAGLRGKVYRYQGAKLIVTYHPAACLRNPGYKRPVWEDMQMLAREYLSD